VALQPRPDSWRLARADVVEDDVELCVGIDAVDPAQEGEEVSPGVAGARFVGHLAGGDIEGGEQLVVPCRS
jgi:hypothetical protein